MEKLKIVDPSADKDAVVKNINNIRSIYKKERKKIANSKKSGAGNQEVYKPKLWYYSIMLFLDDQEEPRHSRSNMDDESTENEVCYLRVVIQIVPIRSAFLTIFFTTYILILSKLTCIYLNKRNDFFIKCFTLKFAV